MLVSHGKRFIYTKTIKTAGTSVESYFEPYCMNQEEWTISNSRKEHISEYGIIGARIGSPIELQASIWWNHMPAQTIRALLGVAVWDQYFKFCVVRNPFEQLVSAMHFFLPLTNPGVLERTKSNEDLKSVFEQWLKSIPLPVDRNKYMIDDKFCMDYVIRFESLTEGIEEVCKKLNIEFQLQRVPYLKQSKRPKIKLKDYYSDASIDLVTRAYEYELEKFNYSLPW
jgi:Sulfotransferase family